ncbi:MAG: flagellar assembly protein FliW [Rickettsiales bacterium]|nr:flagellar assembly protein FliW [Rickettsiales bacterium]
MNELQMAIAQDTNGLVASQLLETATMQEGMLIKSRFGEVPLTLDKPLTVSKGLLGFAGMTQFCLLEFPVKKFQRFQLLQSLEDESLSFIVMPLSFVNPIIERDDLSGAIKELGIGEQNASLQLIVSVHRSEQIVRLSVNARAPLVIDMSERQASQYVFPSNKYKIQHFISAETNDKV